MMVIGVSLIVSGLLLALAVFALLEEHLRKQRAMLDTRLQHIHADLMDARKEIKGLMITREEVKALVDITTNALAAAAGDKAAKEKAEADWAALKATAGWIEDDAELDADIEALIAAAADATPADPPVE